jgi:hypothetical protein
VLVRVLRNTLAALALAGAAIVVPIATAGPAHAALNVEGYVWANQPATADYYPATGYEYNSAGGAIRVQRSGAGNYLVTFERMGVSGGIAHVNAYGWSNSNYCVVAGWGRVGSDEVVRVRCFAAGGVPADSRFVANFTRRDTTGALFLSYLFSHVPNPPAPYVPAAAYRFDTHGGAPQVERVAVGRYLVWDDTYDAASPDSNFSQIRATAYGSTPKHCWVADEGTEGALPLAFLVLCTDAAGAPVDSQFTYTYVRGGNVLGGTPATYGSAIGWTNAVTPVNPALTWYSTGPQPFVEWQAVGRYVVRLAGLASWSGHALAAPVGSDPRHCTVASWWPSGADLLVHVHCFDSTTHLPADVPLVHGSFTT